MSSVEKKFSDFQETECKPEISEEVLEDIKVCPTCQTNPNWVLPAAHWSDIEEAYLNEKFCEYRVLVHEFDTAVQDKIKNAGLEDRLSTTDAIIEVGVERIILFTDKKLSDVSRKALIEAADTADTIQTMYDGEKGLAYLVSVPAFNVDTQENDPNKEEDELPTTIEGANEILLRADGLKRKIRFLRLSLQTYSYYYSSIQHQSNSFTIRQEQNQIIRINYQATIKSIVRFEDELNSALKNAGIPKLGGFAPFHSAQLESIKIIFKDGGDPYELDSIYVQTSKSCNEYVKLNISNSLYAEDLKIVYHFLNNIEKIYKEITAAETKPWLDFTIENFYPTYVVDYGNVIETEQIKSGLQCLLESQLGIGNGKVIDALAAEIVSAFDAYEDEMNEQACRSLTEAASGGGTSLSEKKNTPSPAEQRKLQMRERYKKEFENKWYKEMRGRVARYLGFEENYIPNYTESEIHSFAAKYSDLDKSIEVEIKVRNISNSSTYTEADTVYVAGTGRGSRGEAVRFMPEIVSKKDLEVHSSRYAARKFAMKEESDFIDQIGNSPHFNEALDASREVLKKFEDTYIDVVKDTFNSNRPDLTKEDIINVLGVCGMSKIAGKAFECLAGGISFNSFMEALVEKIFEFMEVNTLDLFFNGLPAPFRNQLEETIREQLGGSIDFQTLLALKKTENGAQKLSDFVSSMAEGKRMQDLFERYENPLTSTKLSPDDRQLLISRLGEDPSTYEAIISAMRYARYSRETKSYPDIPRSAGGQLFPKAGEWPTNKDNIDEYKERKPKKWVKRVIKAQARAHKSNGRRFLDATKRMGNALGAPFVEAYQLTSGSIAKSRIENDISDIRDQIADFQLEFGSVSEMENRKSFLQTELQNSINQEGTGTFESIGGSPSSSPQSRSAQNEIIELSSRIAELKTLEDKLNQLSTSADRDVETIGTALAQAVDPFIISQETGRRNASPSELNQFESAVNSFKTTRLGTKVDIVYDVIFDFVIDSILDSFEIDDLFNELRSYPIVDFALDKIMDLLIDPCPSAPIIYPPPSDFLKSLTFDICDPTFQLTVPAINIPNIDFRFQIEYQFGEIFREAIIKVVSDIVVKILTKLLKTLESALCKLAESAGNFVSDALKDGLPGTATEYGNAFLDALNEAFCNDGVNPDTANDRASELADALFDSVSFDAGGEYSSAGDKAANVISSVASQNEFLESMVASEEEGNEQFYSRVSNAIKTLAPEMVSLLGSPSQVAFFFRNLGSYLSPDDRERIRNLLDAGIPNLPISPALCLTNDQLNEWNNLRESILSGENPSEAVDKLNNATEEALEDIMDTIGDLETDGPFIGSLTNEITKDVCNPNNIINDVSQSDFDKQAEEDDIDDFYKNISKILRLGFFSKGGIIAEALRDTSGRREFGRYFQKLIRLNYSNSQIERDKKYESKLRKSGKKSFGNRLMDVGYDEEDGAPGVYPQTVGLLQRESVAGEEAEGIKFDFKTVKKGRKSSKNISLVFQDEIEDSKYERTIACSTIKKDSKSFNYNMQILEKIDKSSETIELNINVPVASSLSPKIDKYMKENNFNRLKNTDDDIRRALFASLVQQKIPFVNGALLYEKTTESFRKNLCIGLLTNYESPYADLLPMGYKFGYSSSKLTKASFDYLRPADMGGGEYDFEEEEEVLGVFRDPNIVALDPKKYGGRYTNPPYYIQPRNHFGWFELAQKAFDSVDGCDPKTPPVLDFTDISQNTKNLSTSLRNDPRLSEREECKKTTPFDLLLDAKSKARLDGVVRTTLRTYLAEFFMQGYGLFSNLSMRGDNYDDGLFIYIAESIKTQMIQLGGYTSNKKIRIVRERYWYTFLEQVVEAYKNMEDTTGLIPPDNITDALNKIQSGCDLYQQITKENKKEIRKKVKDQLSREGYTRPSATSRNPVRTVSLGLDYMTVMAIAFRITDEEDRENFMDGGIEDRVTVSMVRYASVKKLQFFQKIFFIKLFEREALLIMSEFIKEEFKRMSRIISDGPLDKPYYHDIAKSLIGMQSIFPQSRSRIGLSDYEVKKIISEADPGSIPEIKENNSSSGLEQSEDVRFLVEKYIRLEDRKDVELPSFFVGRNEKYKNYASLTSFKSFLDGNSSDFENEYLSSFFGDLRFIYKSKFSTLLSRGYDTRNDMLKLVSLNSDEDVTLERLEDIKRKYQLDIEYDDVSVFHDDTFIPEDIELPEPEKTIGSTGVKFGIRISIVLPSKITAAIFPAMSLDSNLVNKSLETNSYAFQDGVVQIPVVETEVDVVDKKISDFNPVSEYDLECLVNKMVASTEFITLFDLALGLRQTSTMVAMYAIETMPAAIGRHPTERVEGNQSDPDFEDWDRVVNKFAKNFLRREFKSVYLSRTDSAGDDGDDNDFSLPNLFTINNPFENFTFPGGLPWWLRRRLKTKVLDSNQQECVDPLKDLQ